ncbi:prepilin peptidase [Microbacteriaceae bacterium VKM Ac-2855]|nr:prepilin peptidase [Microbacteriaceae bacterium VKM Ac-2855]
MLATTTPADRPVFVLTGSLLAALAVLAFGLTPELIPALYVAGVTAPLFAIDVRVQRLPNALVLPAYPLVVLSLALQPHPLGVASLAAGVLGVFGLLSLVGGLGMGDVKLVGVLAASLGMLGSGTAVAGLVLPFLLGGACALAFLLSGRRGDIPFGPFLLGGYWLAIALVR